MRLTLRRLWLDHPHPGRDDQILCDGAGIGRMYEFQHGPQRRRWFWTVGTRVPNERGTADSWDEAKASARAAFERLPESARVGNNPTNLV